MVLYVFSCNLLVLLSIMFMRFMYVNMDLVLPFALLYPIPLYEYASTLLLIDFYVVLNFF